MSLLLDNVSTKAISVFMVGPDNDGLVIAITIAKALSLPSLLSILSPLSWSPTCPVTKSAKLSLPTRLFLYNPTSLYFLSMTPRSQVAQSK